MSAGPPDASAASGSTEAASAPSQPPAARRRRWRAWRRRLPLACVACAAIAWGHAAVWAVVTPTFQVPDEQAHFGYVQFLAETGRLPSAAAPVRFTPEQVVLSAETPFSIEGWPTWQPSQSRRLHRDVRRVRPSSIDNEAVQAVNHPPLYYAIEAIPYRAARSLNALDRLFVMRLVSALFAALTVAFTFLFLRELLPGTPWAWTVGALAVAFQPVVAFVAGGVNNDNLVFTWGAALVYLLARAFRRGLSPALGAAIAAVAIGGLLTKTTFLGMLPGAAIGVALAAWRAAPARRPRALRGALTAGGCLALPAVGLLIVNQVAFGRSPATLTGGLFASSPKATIGGNVSYVWQYFLPKLWFLSDRFSGYPLWEVYVQGFVGRFGWFAVGFPAWVNWLATGLYLGAIALAGLALARPGLLRRRWPELVTYITVVLGMLVVVAIAGYRYKVATNLSLEQTRYVLAPIALYGGLIAVAARGAGPRWGRAAGALMVVLAMGHSLFSILLTIAHYYS